MNKTLEAEVNQLHAEICGGLADPNRIMILYTLSQSPHNVTELSNELEMSQPMVSRHLVTLVRFRDHAVAADQGRSAVREPPLPVSVISAGP